MKVLYASEDIFSEIKRIFSLKSGEEEKYILVAYLGKDAEKYIHNTENLTIICSPTPYSTNPDTVRYFLSNNVKVLFSNNLHMKVYWSKIGAIVGSANLSMNALSGNSKECAISVESNEIDIQKLIEYSSAKKVTPASLKKLDRESDQHERKLVEKTARNLITYDKWYKSHYPREWKLGWWDDTGEFCNEALEVSQLEYRENQPHKHIDISKKQARPGEWLLTFEVSNGSQIKWLYIDFIAEVKEEESAFEKDYSFQAVQVRKAKYYPKPPFSLDKKFEEAFGNSLKIFGSENIENEGNLKPKKNFLNVLNSEYNK